jgi:hypothetical protein
MIEVYMNNQPSQNMNVKITDEVLKGSYANMMTVSHTREEFVLDFLNLLPPQGIVNARVITSPGHLKRIIAALSENLKKYEDQFGAIQDVTGPSASEIGFKTQN